MSEIASQTRNQTNAKPSSLLSSGVLQRQCACGNHTTGGGTCVACSEQEQSLQRKTAEGNASRYFNTSFGIPLQRKLTIGASDDLLEKEADWVSDQIMSMPTNQAPTSAPLQIHRFTGQPSGQAGTAPESVNRILNSPGRPLEPGLRQDMESRFGYDFSQVRVHSGLGAEQSARDVNASAYTVAHNIVFGAGQFMPATNRGQRLIAHELVHVLQQEGTFAGVEDAKSRLGSISSSTAGETDTAVTLDLQKRAQGFRRSEQYISRTPRAVRRTPIFKPNCNEYERCKVIEPLRAANQLLDRTLAELLPVASGAVKSGRTVDLLNQHFHDPSNVTKRAAVVRNNYRAIKAELNARVLFVCHAEKDYLEKNLCSAKDAQHTVPAFTGNKPGDDIFLCIDYYPMKCREQARNLIHEACHHIPATAFDHAYVDEPDYIALSPDKAAENPDCYAEFAKMVFPGTPACRDCSTEIQLGHRRY